MARLRHRCALRQRQKKNRAARNVASIKRYPALFLLGWREHRKWHRAHGSICALVYQALSRLYAASILVAYENNGRGGVAAPAYKHGENLIALPPR